MFDWAEACWELGVVCARASFLLEVSVVTVASRADALPLGVTTGFRSTGEAGSARFEVLGGTAAGRGTSEPGAEVLLSSAAASGAGEVGLLPDQTLGSVLEPLEDCFCAF